MEPSGVACTNCGKNMTTDDLRRTACVHCGQVLAHHARAAQQVAVVNQMFAQGLPQQMLAQQYDPYAQQRSPAMIAMMGAPPMAPFGGPQPYMAQAHAMNQVGASVQKAAISVAVIAVVAAALIVVLTCIGVAVAFVLAR